MGLYTIVPPLVAYALFGTSRQLVVGPDTATGPISALTVAAVAAPGTVPFNELTSTLAVVIGAFFLLFGVLRMGWVAAFIPTPVMRGFIEGLVCVTIVGQVPHLLGIESTSGNFFTKLSFVLQQLPHASVAPLLIGMLNLTAMQLMRRFAWARSRIGTTYPLACSTCEREAASHSGHSERERRLSQRRGLPSACDTNVGRRRAKI